MSKARVVFYVFNVGKGFSLWPVLAAELAITAGVAYYSYQKGKKNGRR